MHSLTIYTAVRLFKPNFFTILIINLEFMVGFVKSYFLTKEKRVKGGVIDRRNLYVEISSSPDKRFIQRPATRCGWFKIFLLYTKEILFWTLGCIVSSLTMFQLLWGSPFINMTLLLRNFFFVSFISFLERLYSIHLTGLTLRCLPVEKQL